VFDEIFFCSVRHLAQSRQDRHSHGDTNELECIDCITNQHDYDEYYNKCVDLTFPVGMFFRENNRLKSKKDKETLKCFKRDVLDDRIPIGNTSKKYFNTTKD
ncbi:MAG: hypothetical protein ACKPKO_23470, partial [Candidatus Fonsibacter sp.]